MSEADNILIAVKAQQVINYILDSEDTRKMYLDEHINLIHLFTKDILEGKIAAREMIKRVK